LAVVSPKARPYNLEAFENLQLKRLEDRSIKLNIKDLDVELKSTRHCLNSVRNHLSDSELEDADRFELAKAQSSLVMKKTKTSYRKEPQLGFLKNQKLIP